MSTNNRISKEDAIEIVKRCNSIADFCREVGWEPRGGNYKIFHKYQMEYGLDTSHFNQKHINRLNGGKHDRKSAEEYSKGKYVRSSTLLRKLVEEGLKEWKCECCVNTEWLGDKIPLELHHEDGNHFNNSFENIKLLCPNCHAKTDNYRGKNAKKEKKCSICGRKISRWSRSKICRKCSHDLQRKVEWPNKENLQTLLTEYNFSKVADMFGVTDNAVRKWCRHYGMSTKSNDYKQQ